MQSQLVFQEEKERERLRIQNLLLSQAEKPALEHFFKGKSELSVLDIGCNDGARTFHRFSDDRISRVIGLEYNQQLVERANSQFGNTKFSFYQMDVDRDSFSADFQKLCTEPEDREFDLICLSFVLMHLHDGEKLLRTLKNFLKKGGVIFITESNDRISTLAPDEKNLLGQFLDILKEDKYAGKRETGQAVPGWLTNCGYPALGTADTIISMSGAREFPLPKVNSGKKKIFSRPFFPICPRMWKSCWQKNRITENIRTGRTG